MKFDPMNIPRIIGHRGAKGSAPENTLTSFRKAKELGATWVEFDVKETEDGVLIVMHDETLERTTDLRGEVMQTTWKKLQEADAGAWFDTHFRGERVPTLEQTFHLLSELNMGANIEIKPCPGREERTAIAIAQFVEQKWPAHLPPPLLSSFSFDSLKAARKVNKNLILGNLFETLPPNWHDLAKEIDAKTIHIDHEVLNQQVVHEIRKQNYPILAYTVNDNSRAQTLFQWGVHAVFTDFPGDLKK